MPSTSQPKAAAPVRASLGVISEGVMRVALWLGVVLVIAEALSMRAPAARTYPLVVAAGLVGIALLLSTAQLAEAARAFAAQQPLLTVVLVLVALFPALPLLADPAAAPEVGEVLLSGMLLFLPTASAVLNAPTLRQGDRTLALGTIALPTLLALSQDVPAQPPTPLGVAARGGMVLLVIALGWFTSQAQRARLNLLWLSAALALWAAVVFEVAPLPALDPAVPIPLFWLAALPALMLIGVIGPAQSRIAIAGAPSAKVGWVGFGVSLVVGLGILDQLFLHVLRPPLARVEDQWPALAWLRFSASPLLQAALVFVFFALPEEIAARAALLNGMQEALGWHPMLAGAFSALFFSMLNAAFAPLSPSTALFILVHQGVATAAFLATRSVFTSAAVSALVLTAAMFVR